MAEQMTRKDLYDDLEKYIKSHLELNETIKKNNGGNNDLWLKGSSSTLMNLASYLGIKL